MDDNLGIIGGAHENIQHESAVKHVTGKAIYIDDMPNFPGSLEIVLVTSPFAHANIKSIDPTKALALPGVVAVLTPPSSVAALRTGYRPILHPSAGG